MSTASPSAASGTSKPNAGRIVPFGKYLLLQRVSVGGMAEIFKAVPEGAKRLDNILAIKRILPSIAEDDEFIGMFVDEARIAGQLTHPNICRIYELGKVGETNYIAMQFLWGRDLLKVINRFKRVGRDTPPPLVTYVGAHACAGLHYAHIKRDASGQPLNIIHRDVSPQNIIVGYAGQVKLIDFGVARAASQSQKTQAGVLKGKFGYMSPEMIKGYTIDARSDVFAMGICLWEALTGQRLFYGESDFATLELVREANVDPPSSRVSGIPRELDATVMKALAAEPDDRFSSAAELQAALEDVLARHYRGFKEEDAAVIMRQAFAHEVKRERQRLAVFEEMMAQGRLVRGAELSPLPPESNRDDPAAAGSAAGEGDAGQADPEATVVHEVSDEDLAKLSGEHVGIHEEPTTIFFSADELQEIAEIETTDEGGGAEEVNPLDVELQPEEFPAPAATDVLMPGPRVSLEDRPQINQWTDLSAFDRLPPDTGPIPVDRRDPTEQVSNRAASQTLEIPLLSGPAALSKRSGSSSWGTGAWVTIGLVALLAASLAYLAVRELRANTGNLVVNASNTPGAVVRVDGVMRGNPPLQIDELSAGIHTLQVDAPGYVSVHKRVVVHRGKTTPVNLVLEHLNSTPKIAPMPHASQIQATPSEASEEERKAEELRRERREERRRQRQAREQTDADEPKSARTGSPKKAADEDTKQGASDAEDEAADSNTPGELMISTLPWSRVFVDNVDTGRDTPVRSLKVAPGMHTVGLRTPDGEMHLVEVLVDPGQQVRIIRRF